MIGAIIQARCGSSRLPGKIFCDLPYGSGRSMIEQIVKRMKKSTRIYKVIVATTTNILDNKVEEICRLVGAECYRGDENDVLGRFYSAAQKYGLNHVVRVTGDCRCIDVEIIDENIDNHLNGDFDLSSNFVVRSYPRGYDFEIIKASALEKANFSAKEKFEREHVTPYLYITNPHEFKINKVIAPKKYTFPQIRITVDTKIDYAFICGIYDYLYDDDNYFGVEKVIDLLLKKKWLLIINNEVQHKTYDGKIPQPFIERNK